MPSILNLKFKGNKSFVAFSNLGDTESLTRTWKVCSKVASYLEQGQRLENLSWRLWHLQTLMVDTDNAKSKREFRKLSKNMGDKLDKEKGRSIEELEAPDFKHTPSADMIRQRAAEKERSRQASQNAKPGTIKRMQFTFSIDQPIPPVSTAPVKKPDLKPSAEFKRDSPASCPALRQPNCDTVMADDRSKDQDPPLTQRGRKTSPSSAAVHFPSYFPHGFDASAVLYPPPTLTTRLNYGEGVGLHSSGEGFSVPRPTIELPLDDIFGSDSAFSPGNWSPPNSNPNDNALSDSSDSHSSSDADIMMHSHVEVVNASTPKPNDFHDSSDSDDERDDIMSSACHRVSPSSQAAKEASLKSLLFAGGPASGLRGHTRSNTPGRPNLTVRTQPLTTRASGPGATASNVNPAVLRANGSSPNSAPGGVKAECSNCGATHTPLWRRGLNDELNCNACGLYCKLHKRPRPKSMRNTHGEGRTQAAPRQEAIDIMAQCYNCHTTATPLWRKDDEGKTVCNACGLYYKLHGSARPISMKSDVIRKRSRHDARRVGAAAAETPSASPCASRRNSPVLERSPTLAPDSTTQMTYDYSTEPDYRVSQSELTNALGQDQSQLNNYNQHALFTSLFGFTIFPGPYHPDVLQQQQYTCVNDPLPFASVDTADIETVATPSRIHKRRRMSNDSISEPPSSAASYSSFDGFSSASSATSASQRSSMEFPFSPYPPYNMLRGSESTFWHPPMLPHERSPEFVHPPMLPPDDFTMDYVHPPMAIQDEDSLFSTYLHPPMIPAEDRSPALMSSHLQPHPPMLTNDSMYQGGRNDFFDPAMRSY